MDSCLVSKDGPVLAMAMFIYGLSKTVDVWDVARIDTCQELQNTFMTGSVSLAVLT
jgi:hypothetical protein